MKRPTRRPPHPKSAGKRPRGSPALQQGAQALHELLPVARLHPAVAEWAARRPAEERWAVALSGGADSVALLHLLRAHWPERGLVALHFNHRLRGRAADADEAFCRRLGGELGVTVRVGRWRPPGRAVSEEQARAARLAYFDRAMAAAGTKVLWLGHQQDDIAETMLMRLGRGSGPGGLAAPRPVQPVGDGWRLRPLLTLAREELRSALRSAGVAWREDASNAAGAYLRNRVRHRVLAAWRRADPGRNVTAGAALARERCEEDDAALEFLLGEIAPLTPAGRLRLDRLAGRPRALWRRALHRWLLANPHGSDLSRQGFELLLRRAEAGRPGRFSLGPNGFAVVRRGWLVFEREG